jgi:hypothetical protein
MLHRITKIIAAYVGSVCERKHVDLDSKNFTVEIIVSTRQANGDLISVTNHIDVLHSLPNTYSETVRNSTGQTLIFIAGASGNKRKFEQDKLVNVFSEAKATLAEIELKNAMVAAKNLCDAQIELGAIDNRLFDVASPVRTARNDAPDESELIVNIAHTGASGEADIEKALATYSVLSKPEQAALRQLDVPSRMEALTAEPEVKILKAKKTRVKKVKNESQIA